MLVGTIQGTLRNITGISRDIETMSKTAYQTLGPTSMDCMTDMKVSPNGRRVAIGGVRTHVEVLYIKSHSLINSG